MHQIWLSRHRLNPTSYRMSETRKPRSNCYYSLIFKPYKFISCNCHAWSKSPSPSFSNCLTSLSLWRKGHHVSVKPERGVLLKILNYNFRWWIPEENVHAWFSSNHSYTWSITINSYTIYGLWMEGEDHDRRFYTAHANSFFSYNHAFKKFIHKTKVACSKIFVIQKHFFFLIRNLINIWETILNNHVARAITANIQHMQGMWHLFPHQIHLRSKAVTAAQI